MLYLLKFLCSVATSFLVVESVLLVKPNNIVAVAGSRIMMFCSTSLTNSSVSWYQQPADPSLGSFHEIVDAGEITSFQYYRYDLDHSFSIGQYNLVIKAVDSSDAGLYVCRDDKGRGEDFGRAKLIVMESDNVSCLTDNIKFSTAGESDSSPTQLIVGDFVSFSCNISFFGKAVPDTEFTEWPFLDLQVSNSNSSGYRGKVNFRGSITVRETTEQICTSLCYCSLIQQENLKGFQNNSFRTRARFINCLNALNVSFPVRDILIVAHSVNSLYHIGETIECHALGFPEPMISWIDHSAENDGTSTVINGSQLNLLRVGTRQVTCVASNIVRGVEHSISKSITLHVVQISSSKSQEQPSSQSISQFIPLTWVAAAVAAVVVLIIFVAAFHCCCSRSHRSRQQHSANVNAVQVIKPTTDTEVKPTSLRQRQGENTDQDSSIRRTYAPLIVSSTSMNDDYQFNHYQCLKPTA